jgi:hypothetical protein
MIKINLEDDFYILELKKQTGCVWWVRETKNTYSVIL